MKLRFMTYSGMPYDMAEDADPAEIRREAARSIRAARRRGQPVSTLEPGIRWEFMTPDDAWMIGDRDGFMRVEYDQETDDDSGFFDVVDFDADQDQP